LARRTGDLQSGVAFSALNVLVAVGAGEFDVAHNLG
jgi:hypothetical protein